MENTDAEVEAIFKGPQIAKEDDKESRANAIREWVSVSTVRLNAAKVLQDSRKERLRKILPDLKAVELSQDPDNPVFKDERALDSEFARLVQAVAAAEGRTTAPVAGKGKVH